MRRKFAGFSHPSCAETSAVCPGRTFATSRPGCAGSWLTLPVSGSLAVVRPVWHITSTRPGHAEQHTTEPGLDVFRHEPDGRWRIIRLLPYEAPAE